MQHVQFHSKLLTIKGCKQVFGGTVTGIINGKVKGDFASDKEGKVKNSQP